MLIQTLVLATACLGEIKFKFTNQSPKTVSSESIPDSIMKYSASFSTQDRINDPLKDSVTFAFPAGLQVGKPFYRVNSASLNFYVFRYYVGGYKEGNNNPMKLKIEVGEAATPAITVDMPLIYSSKEFRSNGNDTCFVIPDSNSKLYFTFEVPPVQEFLPPTVIGAIQASVELKECEPISSEPTNQLSKTQNLRKAYHNLNRILNQFELNSLQ